jgi:hypothetical protein
MLRVSFVLFSTLAFAIAGCGSAAPTADTPPAGGDAKAPEGGTAKAPEGSEAKAPEGGEAKGYGYEFKTDSVKDPKPAETSAPGTIKAGRLAPEVIQGVVRQNFGKFRACYEAGLKKDPKLAGDIKVRFVIKEDGTVTDAKDEGSTLADKDVVACVVGAVSPMTFPKPEGGIVTVVYPIKFTP